MELLLLCFFDQLSTNEIIQRNTAPKTQNHRNWTFCVDGAYICGDGLFTKSRSEKLDGLRKVFL